MNSSNPHLFIGQLGHFLVILALASSLLATIAFSIATMHKDPQFKPIWIRYAKTAFGFQAAAALGVFICLFLICFNHYYEYQYAFKHTSDDLESKYLFACIWEGQEGSFLLWIIWQAVLGVIVMTRKKDNWQQTWNAPVMSVISFSQFFLILMILGVYIGNARIGNSPFLLAGPETIGQTPSGLNVLLRNYWMVIHPPVLFLGFASTIIPFAFAFAGLQTQQHHGWVKKAMPWTLFSVCILGVGIMMGGKWAYESLNFGGYWAWDPVENASLVPWLIIVAGLHTMLIFQATGRSLKATYVFLSLGYIFVLYSTFLTRTGILGDASVHAFTDAGKVINIMILAMLLCFALGSITFYFIRQHRIPTINQEEELHSREFWMFTGSLILFMSGIFVIIITSIPVYDKIPFFNQLIRYVHKGPLALPEDPEYLYNKVMIMVAFILGVVTGAAQFLKYKKSTGTLIWIAIPAILSLIISAIIYQFFPLQFFHKGNGFLWSLYFGLAAMLYTIFSNAIYLLKVFKYKIKLAGSSLSHIGFGLMIAGMIISSANKKVISDSSVNHINIEIGQDPMTKKKENPRENLTLVRNIPTAMGDYIVTYTDNSKSSKEKSRTFFKMHFEELSKTGATKDTFSLQPDVYLMKGNGMSSNPDTRHYLNKDIFTYISAVPNQEESNLPSYNPIILKPGQPTPFEKMGYFTLDSISTNPAELRNTMNIADSVFIAHISFVLADSNKFKLHPALIMSGGENSISLEDSINSLDLKVNISSITKDGIVKLGVSDKKPITDFITVKTYIFPYINLVWLGLIIMALGIFISMLFRAGVKGSLWTFIFTVFALAITYMFLFAG
jgi:cytochrome c-type biogenesis protein CcmF